MYVPGARAQFAPPRANFEQALLLLCLARNVGISECTATSCLIGDPEHLGKTSVTVVNQSHSFPR